MDCCRMRRRPPTHSMLRGRWDAAIIIIIISSSSQGSRACSALEAFFACTQPGMCSAAAGRWSLTSQLHRLPAKHQRCSCSGTPALPGCMHVGALLKQGEIELGTPVQNCGASCDVKFSSSCAACWECTNVRHGSVLLAGEVGREH